MAEAFNADYPTLKVDTEEGITENERICLFDNLHSYRGDRSEYILRSTMTRVYYKDKDFPPHNTRDMHHGDVLIDNEGYGQYKGETQIALKDMKTTDVSMLQEESPMTNYSSLTFETMVKL